LFPVADASTATNTKLRLILLYWLPAIAWTLFILRLSGPSYGFHHSDGRLQTLLQWLHIHIRQETTDMVNGFIRKSGHVVVYWILSLLWFRALRGVSKIMDIRMRWIWTALVICLCVASIDEYHQFHVLGRSGEWHDILLDMIGAGYAQWLIFRIR